MPHTPLSAELVAAHDALTRILDGSPVATFVLDSDHVVTHWNKACERILGQMASTMIGSMHPWQAFYDTPRPVMADLILGDPRGTLAQFYPGKYRPSPWIAGAYEAEDYFPRFQRWLQFTAAPLRDKQGLIIGAIETLQDISERKQAEVFLFEAKQQAEAATRAKAEFLANVSHEIRTPMNAVIGLAHLLLKSELSSKQREQIGRIHGAGKMLLGLINDILDFSKIEAGRMTLEETSFNLDDSLDGLATVVLGQAQAKGLEVNYVVEPEVPMQLIGDPLRFSQILVNLMSNALKFTAQGGVTLFIRVAERAGERVRLEIAVQDTGVGMSAEQQRQLFQAFTQADTSITRKYGGTGLGLTICKRLVELMGGEIWLSSKTGIGSTFSFTADFGVAPTPAPVASPARGRALIVDDSTISCMVLNRFLQQAGYTVTVATSGREALDILGDDGHYDCVALDYLLPDLDGLVIAQAIRRRSGQQPHLVMVTAADTSTLENAPGFSEFDEVLHKPVTAAHIQNLVKRLSGTISFRPGDRRQPPRLIGMRVLLAEDIPTNQFIAREILESFGIVVDIASDGRETLTQLERHPYDLILMDVQMPEMDGIEATKIIRSQPRWNSLPIIAMTAHAFDSERQRCLAAGMNDFLTKPIDPDALQATLIEWRPPTPEVPPAAAVTESEVEVEAEAILSPPEIPLLPGIDTVEGLRRMMNKPGLYERVLRDFHRRFRDESALIQTALLVFDHETALRRAHTIKGLAGSIGANDLQAAALALENSIRQLSPSLDADMKNFSAHLELILSGLAEAFKL